MVVRPLLIMISKFILTDFANKDAARKTVRFERKLELGMEGHRFFDLVRWGIADVVLNTEYFPKEGARRVKHWAALLLQKINMNTCLFQSLLLLQV